MQKIIILIVTFIFLFPMMARASDPLNQGAALNLQRCIEIALEKHPSIKASAGAIKMNESKVGQAKANYYPQLNLTSSVQRIDPHYSTDIIIGMTLFDFGKTSSQVDIQDLNVNASRADYEDVTNSNRT